jgi:hypothetical protein
LLSPTLEVLEKGETEEGLGFMRGLEMFIRARGAIVQDTFEGMEISIGRM